MRNVHFLGRSIHSSAWPCHLSSMAFIRIRTINGKEYTYEEHRWRGADGKVKSKSIYLGPGRARRRSIFAPVEEPGLRYIERLMERDAAKSKLVHARPWAADTLTAESLQLMEERDRLEAAKDKLSKELGVQFGPANPTPIEKTSTPATQSKESQPAEATAASASPGPDGPAGKSGSDSSG